ncbi:hypothetical protein LTV02_18635 [Nocardia yamanashiensis]|uniref:hypothetical protein n=1 Tax=Nocardia yamanashiensis TaxID=209247 RepID=UPI001E4DAD0C|nr:hypothetical protein [Nocardia yamanashiensis]UGT45275.1 hypothetical protein LTV02_18635 [Nocardia yamanashiensis]
MNETFESASPNPNSPRPGGGPYPRWYHSGLAVTVGAAFAVHSLVPHFATTLMVLLLTVAPLVLSRAVQRQTGMDPYVHRYSVRETQLYLALTFALLILVGAGALVQVFFHFRWTWAVCGIVAGAALWVAGPRIDGAASSGRIGA